jgi:hypothetical protein
MKGGKLASRATGESTTLHLPEKAVVAEAEAEEKEKAKGAAWGEEKTMVR